ncbi:bifunctional folylpolyglutamate synthase/dihydrofolate synthase [Patescibacteria group bacterium]|nr:bifunctional folylpolyglutamate synthase/dihydrofolate synthase [Patescibacteria group bacterium]MBU1075240.1 bifunctional folylpolyglutamate synthase/dihydrofolate synthase [Patescibacteria group bacterium]MBU1952501.1 bifunctional folylpolyglutamate synthase/dihydrofolate synthase [Patescibacteria group bacterium]
MRSTKDIFSQYQKYLKPYDPRFVSKDFLQLHRINLLLKEMGSPENNLIGVQVAGTKGKGSTVAFLQQILVEAGYKTGSFYSPYLVSPGERIMINGKPIAKIRVKAIADKMIPLLKTVGKKLGEQVTFFEFTTAIAIKYFAEEKVDIILLEVGLGGRLDATTAVGLKNKIITNISYDHTKSLGKTITKIAGEKAGIIQKHDKVVTATSNRALQVISNRAKTKKASLLVVDKDIKYSVRKVDLTGAYIDISCMGEGYKNLKLSLIGRHQAANFACAFGMVQELCKQGFVISPQNIVEAAGKTRHQARFHIWGKNPLTVLDGAHNLHSIRALVNVLRDIKVNPQKTVFVLSIKNTKKQIPSMLRTLSDFSKKIILPDVTNIYDLKDFYTTSQLKKRYPKAKVASSLSKGIADAKKMVGKNGVVVITGSLYTIGEILKKDGGRKM